MPRMAARYGSKRSSSGNSAMSSDDFAPLVEYAEEKLGCKAAWALALTIAVIGPVVAVLAGFWWYLG